MLSKSKITLIRSLKLRKYREKYDKVLVEGVKIVGELMRSYPGRIELVCCTRDWYNDNAQEFDGLEVEVHVIDEKTMKQVSAFKTPQPVLSIVKPPTERADAKTPGKTLCLYLDGIRDPGNVGTIFRIADWFGAGAVFLSDDCADVYNPKVIQASMGSVFRVEWRVIGIDELVGEKDFGIFVATMDGTSLQDVPPPQTGILVLGNEARGVRTGSMGRPFEKITIPGSKDRGAESLNVAVAAGIICACFNMQLPHRP